MAVFTFHLAELPSRTTARALVRPPVPGTTEGLRHAECLAMMTLGSPTFSTERMQLGRLALFAAWDDEDAIDRFLDHDRLGRRLADGWHVRLEFLRKYGDVACLPDLPTKAGSWDPEEPVVAVTLARLSLGNLPRFLKWGKPVERLVADHPATTLALAAMRPPGNFSTFSVWRSVREMTEMVHGRSDVPDARRHAAAMEEQRRRDFHRESTFMRFRPLSEHGEWQGRTGIVPGLA
ncbi:hypothetical protein [Nocardioides cavernaquae]|uniref:Spheroidene monooxygenase n=1 Tax=Nocardioides cavernaquae TaxID=2321396 RepID=A0A3A5H8U8_9ACTN|nr:hypothetical protein [Nocardioides cavernaquae]RJS46278.1 hypothetical protein D4739_08675 [Nocardioides cavernaquae]